jgi:toxin ParE1/3/4
MAYNYSLHTGAKEDIEEAISHYSDINPKLSLDLLNEFYQNIEIVLKRPFLFSASTRKKYRKIPLHRFPYKIFYIVQKEEIIVLAFAHHKRKPNYWKQRK